MTESATGGVDEFDIPLGGLPRMGRLILGRTQMEAAVAEVRFLSDRTELPRDAAVAVWQGLGESLFPVFERTTLNTLNITVSPEGAEQVTQQQSGWVLATPDRAMVVTLLPTMVVVQTTRYERFSTSLAAPLKVALERFSQATGATVVQRIGLRYVNRLTNPDAGSPAFWAEHVRSSFRGPLSGELAHLVESAHQQAHFRLDGSASARVQSGVFREATQEERFGFLVDLDVFREQAMAFEPTTCANLTRQLNRTALALFCQVLSEDYLDKLEPTSGERGQG